MNIVRRDLEAPIIDGRQRDHKHWQFFPGVELAGYHFLFRMREFVNLSVSGY